MHKLRVLFMGTPDFAVPSLKLLHSKYNVVAVICQPDKVNGRGNKVTFGPVKEFAIRSGIEVYQPETFKDNACLDLIKELDPELIVVAAYGKILPEYVLNYAKYGCINVHGSLLPKYRGASPIQAAVLNGDKETGITIMHMSKGLDCGDIILSKNTEIGVYETAGELFDRLSEMGAECLDDAITQIVNGTATRTPQDDMQSSYVSMIKKEMGELDFSISASEIKNKVYGLNPWPTAFINTNSGMIKIFKVVFGNDIKNVPPATVVSVSKSGIEVACGDGKSVIITELQKQGKKRMDAYSFSLGHTILEGTEIYSI